jgi:iron-sulfur cluster assembly protein
MITLTPSAIQRVQAFTREHPRAVGLRLSLKKTGCSGWAYVVDVAHEQAANDVVFESQGVRVVVDPVSLPLLDGTEIDFVRKGLNAEFAFRNPNATGECGCGESFSVERAAIG